MPTAVRPPGLVGPPIPVARPAGPPALGPGPLLGAPGASDQEKVPNFYQANCQVVCFIL